MKSLIQYCEEEAEINVYIMTMACQSLGWPALPAIIDNGMRLADQCASKPGYKRIAAHDRPRRKWHRS